MRDLRFDECCFCARYTEGRNDAVPAAGAIAKQQRSHILARCGVSKVKTLHRVFCPGNSSQERTARQLRALKRDRTVRRLHVQCHSIQVQRFGVLAELLKDGHQRHIRLGEVGVEFDAVQEDALRSFQLSRDDSGVSELKEVYTLRGHAAAADVRRPPPPRAPPAATRARQ